MHYFFEDLLGLAAATPLAALLILMPGFGMARLLSRAGVAREDDPLFACLGLVLGPALLPAADALLLRWAGFPTAIVLHLALAVYGAQRALDALPRVRGW